MKKYFGFDVYRHHECSIIFIVITCSTLIFISSFLTEENELNIYQIFEEKYGSYFYCLIIILCFVFMSFLYSYSRSYSKVLMQVKSLSPDTIIIFIGIGGFIVSIISSIFYIL